MSQSRLLGVAVVIASAGCVAPPASGVAEQQVSGECGWALCGNTPNLMGPFYELDMTGIAYSQLGGYRIKRFSIDGTELDLSVSGFDVAGKPKDGGDRIVNAALVGAVFEIEQAGNPNYVEVTIDEVGSISYFEGGDVDDVELPTFKLSFEVVIAATGEHTVPQPVCPMASVLATDPFDRHALLFTGERYTMSGGISASGAAALPWFNITCNDTSIWKAALFRLVSAAETRLFPSDIDDYVAAVRSIRADYCGDGVAHTKLGTIVDWENHGGWLTKGAGLTLEAIWDQHGAVCLSKPRLADLDPDDLDCDIPTCNKVDATSWKANGYRMATWVPAGPAILVAP